MKTKILFNVAKGAVLPTRHEGENAGFDLYAFGEGDIYIDEFDTKMIPTGLRSVIEDDYYAQLFERGSTGSIGMKYSAGVVDSSYRGEWNVFITNCNSKPILITDKVEKTEIHDNIIMYPKSKGIAQFVVLPVPKVEIEEVNFETIMSYKSNRMEGKIGSSGK